MNDRSIARHRGTAIITGASSGIGAAFARRLAGRGHDVVLVARRRQRLEALAAEIREDGGVAEVLAADLSRGDELAPVEEAARRPSVSVVVNNAGFGAEGDFAVRELDILKDMVAVHVAATMALAHAALPGMVARRRGHIINVSSVAGFMATPGGATYCGTKSFLNTFSRALAAELRGTGVTVQALCPGFTWSEFHDPPRYPPDHRDGVPRFLWSTAEAVVDASLAALPSGRVIVIPGWKNRIIARTFSHDWAARLVRRLRRSR